MRLTFKRLLLLPVLGFLAGVLSAFASTYPWSSLPALSEVVEPTATPAPLTAQGWPILQPQPVPQEVWSCEVIVVGGSLGGVAAASHAMQSGSQTCLIELTPWLGGQISSQGVSALDESLPMRQQKNYSATWSRFKQVIERQPVDPPTWLGISGPKTVADINSCWVGFLCFPPKAGVRAAEQLLQASSQWAPGSRWQTNIAFKGAEFDATGTQITAIYAVRRIPRQTDYFPQGRLSKELIAWYSWAADDQFEKVAIKLQAPTGRRLMVIDATDTGELVGWAGIPHRLGSEGQQTTGELRVGAADNPECTQAFTYPFVLALHNDQGQSLARLSQIQTGLSKAEHRRDYSLEGFPMFAGKSVFHYRRIVSWRRNDPFVGIPALGDMTVVNWNRGNDWGVMNPPLIMTDHQIQTSGQQQNWRGGLNLNALKDGEDHALLFAEWLMENQSTPQFPLTFLSGSASPLGTESGLSIYPYIREGRRILGRTAYGQENFMMREQDIRSDVSAGRDFSPTSVGFTHYAIDIHGCRYRNWQPSGSASSAPASEFYVRPILLPLESLIPQRIDNLLIGGKGIAVTHIVNAATRTHYGEWSIGAAAGATAGWLLNQSQPDVIPAEIATRGLIEDLQKHLKSQGLRLTW